MASTDEIERYIKLAVDNGLTLLEVGDIKIVPGQSKQDLEFTVIKEAVKRNGRPLNNQERQDELLFGPGGSIKRDDEF